MAHDHHQKANPKKQGATLEEKRAKKKAKKEARGY